VELFYTRSQAFADEETLLLRNLSTIDRGVILRVISFGRIVYSGMLLHSLCYTRFKSGQDKKKKHIVSQPFASYCLSGGSYIVLYLRRVVKTLARGGGPWTYLAVDCHYRF